MSRDLSPEVEAALGRSDLRVALFYEGEFADGWLRLWTGLGDIVWGGRTWVGAGTLMGIGTLDETMEIIASGTSITLSGVPSALQQLALAQAEQGAPGRVYMGLLNPPQRNFARGASAVTDTSIWPASVTSNGVTITRVGTGMDDDLSRVSLRYEGTPTQSFVTGPYLSTAAVVSPAAGQWTLSARVRRAAGDPLPAGRFVMRLMETGVGTTLSDQPDSWEYQELIASRHMTSGTQIVGQIGLSGLTVGEPIDITYRVAGLQLEPGGQRSAWQPYGAAPWTPLVADPVLMFGGRLDVPEVMDGADTCTLRITYESRLIDLMTPRELRYTHETQQLLFPGDLAFEYVTSIQDKELRWGS